MDGVQIVKATQNYLLIKLPTAAVKEALSKKEKQPIKKARQMSEGDILKIIARAEEDIKAGRTRLFDDLIREDYPELAHLLSSE